MINRKKPDSDQLLLKANISRFPVWGTFVFLLHCWNFCWVKFNTSGYSIKMLYYTKNKLNVKMKILFNSARVLREKGIFGVKEQVGIIKLILSIRNYHLTFNLNVRNAVFLISVEASTWIVETIAGSISLSKVNHSMVFAYDSLWPSVLRSVMTSKKLISTTKV